MKEKIPYDLIKKHYQIITPRILEASNYGSSKWYDPYSRDIDWLKIFTPIELDAWQDIRGYGKIPLYPQYPVDNYFLDFGNPFLKIALECDGKEFHSNKDIDKRRDENLNKLGWIVFRISGADCKKIIIPSEYDENKQEILTEYYKTTIEGLLRAIHLCLINKQAPQEDDDNEFGLAIQCLEKRSSGFWKPTDDLFE